MAWLVRNYEVIFILYIVKKRRAEQNDIFLLEFIIGELKPLEKPWPPRKGP